jgi:glycosyltransferase involved in cell wall biosynthesis
MLKILHLWDYKVESGQNLDDYLSEIYPGQLAVIRLRVATGDNSRVNSVSLHSGHELISPYPKNVLFRFLDQMGFRWFIKRQLAKYKPDLVFFHFAQTSTRYVRLIEKMGIPTVTGVYGHDISSALSSLRWRLLYRRFKSTAGLFLVQTMEVQSRLLDLGIPSHRIMINQFPIKLDNYLNLQRLPKGSTFRITIPGRFVEKKGHIFLLNALKLLDDSGFDFHLTAIGYGGDLANLQLYTRNIGLDTKVTWIDSALATSGGGFEELYLSVLSGTDLVVLPCVTSQTGDNEAGPALSLCFAQAAGVPVLTTPFRGHELTIADGETGLVSATVDPDTLSSKIKWAQDHPRELEEISQAGKEKVSEVFYSTTNLNKLGAICEAAIESFKVGKSSGD